MAPARHQGARPRQQATTMHPGQAQPATAEAIAMLARIQAATTRLEEKVSAVLAALAAPPPPTAPRAPRQPRARHAPRHPLNGRLSCKDRRPRPGRRPRCAHSRESE